MELLQEFNVKIDEDIKKEFLLFLHRMKSGVIPLRINTKIIDKIAKLVLSDTIMFGRVETGFITKILSSITDIISKLSRIILRIKIDKIPVTLMGFYSRKDNMIVILVDYLEKQNLHQMINLLYITLHELSHLNYYRKFKIFNSIMDEAFTEYYTNLSIQFKYDYPYDVDVKVMGRFLNKLIEKIYLMEGSTNRYLNDPQILALIENTANDKVFQDNEKQLIDFAQYIYDIGVYGYKDFERDIHNFRWQKKFLYAYTSTFRPKRDLTSIIRRTFFYQELFNKSEITSIIVPAIVNSNIKKYLNEVQKVLIL